MLVSAISNLSSAKNSQYSAKNTASNPVKNSRYDHYNYFGANKDNNQQSSINEMFHKIALWKEFCEKNIITDESQKETFNYLA